MKKLLFTMFVALLMVGCGDDSESVEPLEASQTPGTFMYGWMKEIFEEYKVDAEKGILNAQQNLVWHYENGDYDNRDRFITYMTYLKAPEEGGETEFLHQSKRIDSVAGRTLIWPAGFTHKHRGNPPLKGEKIYLTGWVNLSHLNTGVKE